MPRKKTKIQILDANVLIDYQKSDLSILGLVDKHVGEVHILTTVIEEVDGVDATSCERLGLKALEPELDQLVLAAAIRGSLSFQDHLCLIVAKAAGFSCITNDKALRAACQAEGIEVYWGLEIMTELVRLGKLPAEEAIRVAEEIHLSNPLHIPRALVDRFTKKVTSIETKRQGKTT